MEDRRLRTDNRTVGPYPLFLRTHLRLCPLVTTGGVCNCGA